MSLPGELLSAVGIDYGQLCHLLASGNWQQADTETARLMNEVIERVIEGQGGIDNLDPEEIVSFPQAQFWDFPCPDLQTIDTLWAIYSSGRFSFSVQKLIWNEVEKDYVKFSDRVGWRSNGRWLNYPELIFSQQAPIGHLPALSNGAWARHSGGWVGGWGLLIHCFVHRLADCEIQNYK